MRFDASLSNPIYGNADTVQPPSLTAIPIIKAFSADVEPIEPTSEQELRTEVALQASELAKCGVVEQGDGYIRYANGLQICWGIFIRPALNNAVWARGTVSFPLPFANSPTIQCYRQKNASGYANLELEVYSYSKDGFTAQDHSSTLTTTNADAQELSYIAIGRWK